MAVVFDSTNDSAVTLSTLPGAASVCGVCISDSVDVDAVGMFVLSESERSKYQAMLFVVIGWSHLERQGLQKIPDSFSGQVRAELELP